MKSKPESDMSSGGNGEQAEPPPPEPFHERRAAPWASYKPGAQTSMGDEVKEIIQLSEKCIVFLNNTNNLQWEFNEHICIDGDASGVQAMDLIAQVNDCIVKPAMIRHAYGVIAAGLSHAFEDRKAGDTRDFFAPARAYIESVRRETLTVYYLATAAITGVGSASLLLALRMLSNHVDLRQFTLCASMGVIGTLLSIWLRFRTLPIERYSSRLFTAMSAISRIVLGAMCGAIFLLLQRAGVLLTILTNDFAIAAAALVSGFSERMIPDLLSAFENRILDRRRDRTA